MVFISHVLMNHAGPRWLDRWLQLQQTSLPTPYKEMWGSCRFEALWWHEQRTQRLNKVTQIYRNKTLPPSGEETSEDKDAALFDF